jgi:hypothetical protein
MEKKEKSLFWKPNKMILEKYNSIMKREEAYRNKWALGLSVSFSVLIFVSFAFYKGYINLGNNSDMAKQKNSDQLANVVSAKSLPTPIDNTKETLKAAFGEIGKQYAEFKNSVSSVLVPFITGIEVYERK